MITRRPSLVVAVCSIVFGHIVGALVLSTGCGPTFAEIDKASDATAAKLQKCRGEARADFYVGGKSVEDSLKTYESCKKREGL